MRLTVDNFASGRMCEWNPLARDPEPPSVFKMNARNLLIPLLCLGALALACGPRSRSEASLATVSVSKEAPAARSKQSTSNVTRISSSFTVAEEPRGLRFSLDVTNVGKKNVELAFPDG